MGYTSLVNQRRRHLNMVRCGWVHGAFNPSTSVTPSTPTRILSEFTLSKLAMYDKDFTVDEKFAVDDFLKAVGAGTEGSIYSKLNVLMLPCLGATVRGALVDMIDGVQHLSLSSSCDASKLSLENGKIKRGVAEDLIINNQRPNDTSIFNSTSVIGGSFWVKGSGKDSSRAHYNTEYTNKVGLNMSTAKYYTYAQFNDNQLVRGFSVNNSQKESMVFAPSANIASTNISGFDTIIVDRANYSVVPRYIELYNDNQYLSCYAVGAPLTQTELDVLVNALSALLTAFGVEV